MTSSGTSALPQPEELSEPLHQALAGLLRYVGDAPAGWLSSVELSIRLSDSHGIRIHWRTIDALFGGARELVDRRKRRTRWVYKPLAAATSALRQPDDAITLVDPSQAVQATIRLHDVLAGLTGDVHLCDPYLDDVSLEHLSSVPRSARVEILTHKIYDTGKLRRVLAAFRTEGRTIEIRQARAGVLHDRYIVDGASMLIMGGSLNGFGKKQTFLIRAGADTRQQMLQFFAAEWAAGSPWP
jgi:hypothetical protein